MAFERVKYAMVILHILLALIVVLFGTKLFNWYRRRLAFIRTVDKLRGPPSYPVVGSLLNDLIVPRQGQFKHSLARTRKYGPLYRSWWGPRAIVHFSRPEHVELLLSNNHNIDKSFGYFFIQPWLGTGLLTAKGQKWSSHRKMFTPTFHFDILENYVDIFVQKSDILEEKLTKLSQEHPEGFDIFPFIAKCALDIICKTAMGTEVHAQDSVDSEYVRAVYEISSLIMERAIRPWFWPAAIFAWSHYGRRHKACLDTLHGFTRRVIGERKRERAGQETRSENTEDELGRKRRVAFLDLLLEASENSTTPLTDEEIREEVDTFMFEGHDTTSAAIAWTLFLLGSHPDHQEQIFAELEDVFADDPDRKITSRDCARMKYLERAIKESLRLFPSVPFIGRHLSEDVHIGDTIIPAGCHVLLEIACVHRCEDHYPNPDVFQPDNFLPENIHKKHNFAYIPFSAGPRNCIGQKFALLEEKCIIASILRKFKVTALEKMEDLVLMNELILRPMSGVKVKLEPRQRAV